MLIRFATISDLPAMTNLLVQLFTIETDFTINVEKHTKGLTMLLQNGCSIVVAEVNNQVVGMLAVHKGISTAEGAYTAMLEDFIIDAPYRNNGLGAKMLHFVEDWAIKNNIVRLQLLADMHNTAALKFYSRHKWKETNMHAWQKLL